MTAGDPARASEKKTMAAPSSNRFLPRDFRPHGSPRAGLGEEQEERPNPAERSAHWLPGCEAFEALLEQTRGLVCFHDVRGRILAANAEACNILRIPQGELRGMSLRDLLAPDVREFFEAYLDRVVQNGIATGMMKVVTRDGRVRIWTYRNTVRGSGPFDRVVFGVARDVTEGGEAAVRDHRLDTVVENTSDIIGIIDADGVIRYHTPSLVRIVGSETGELSGTRLVDRVHTEDAARVAEFVSRQASGASQEPVCFRLRREDGSWATFEMIGRKAVIDGGVPSVVVNARDVTERDLLQRQLARANRLTGLGHLAATVAHEFNNVLMGIQPFADLLQRPDPTPELLRKCGSHIARSIQRGKRVALDILRFTQPAAPDLKAVDLQDWWHELESEVRGLLAYHTELEVNLVPGLGVVTDASQLAQVITNLVSNARDAMPSGGRLVVSARQPKAGETFPFGVVAAPESYVQISVADTGTGITPDIIGHVFDPLFTTKEAGGTGLGLAVAHQVVTGHGGHIFVESEAGSGTIFHLFLPKAARVPEAAVLEGSVSQSGVRARRILIVDDEEAILDGISELLSWEGLEVRVASSGQPAIDIAAEFVPELVVLDLCLPDMDGVEVARRLRQDRPALPIVFATGHGDRGQIAIDERTFFLRKPFCFDALLEAIRVIQETAGSPS